jgi:hypothetical protein
MESQDRENIEQTIRNFVQIQKDELQIIYKKYKRDIELKESDAKQILSKAKLYSITNFLIELLVGNFLRAFLSFIALYLLLNYYSESLEKLLTFIHFQEVFPNFDIRFLTVFISLATIVGANVTTSRNENMVLLEERLAQKATADVTKKIGDLQDDVYSLRQLFYKQQEELFNLKTDVSSLKTDVSSLKTDVSSLKTDVSSLKTKVDRILEILESNNT